VFEPDILGSNVEQVYHWTVKIFSRFVKGRFCQVRWIH